VLQWFRKKARPDEAPVEAAPSAPQEARPPSEAGGPGEQAKRRRRRGSRGGRGRKKTGTGAEAAVAERAEAKPKAPATRGGRSRSRTDSKPKSDEEKGKRRRQQPRRTSSGGTRAALAGVKKEILVSVDVGEVRVAILEDGKPSEVYMERPGKRSIAGNVYKGVVDNVLPGMEASFVDIGLEKNGFLYVDEIVVPELEGKRHGRRIQELISRGEEVLVQAVKDPMGTKGARLTTEISLPGRFLVYTPFGEGVGISRRLDDAERDRLKAIAKELEVDEGGIIIRTAAEGASKEELEGDLALLRKLWSTMKGKAARTKAPELVYQEAELPIRIVRDLFIRDFERVVVDHDRTYRRIVGYLRRMSKDLAGRVELYSGRERLMEASGVEQAVQSTLDRRVDLPSGGYLIFDYAEAFTVIDVNTGRFVGARGKASGGRLEDTITKNNLEAVEEVVRQLRLRDIGGIIVIDFIDMANPKNRQSVEDALSAELEKDRTKTYVVEISPLGLVEMTRQNVTDGPREIMTVKCEVCDGDGIIVSDETEAIRIERELRRVVTASRHQAFRIELNTRVAAALVGPGAQRLAELERMTGRRFFVNRRDDVPAGRLEVLERGSVTKLEDKQLPVSPGDALDVRLESKDRYSPGDAVARRDGYVISVADAANKIGKTARVRIERATPGLAYAVLAVQATEEAPVEAGTEVEGDGAGEPRKSTRNRGGRGRKPAEAKAEQAAEAPKEKPAPRTRKKAESKVEKPESVEVAASETDGAEPEPKPKKKTRRGSRGGRGRKKKTAVATTEATNGAAPDGQPPVQPEAQPAQAAEPGAEAAPSANGGEPGPVAKPKKKTRRGSRGGRNRRKKPAAAPVDGSAPADEPVATVAAEEERG
jgi:ribonuclease G